MAVNFYSDRRRQPCSGLLQSELFGSRSVRRGSMSVLRRLHGIELSRCQSTRALFVNLFRVRHAPEDLRMPTVAAADKRFRR
jgi:hypothetical protein